MMHAIEHQVSESRGVPVQLPVLGRHVDLPRLGPLEGEMIVSGWVLCVDGPCERVSATADGVVIGHVRPDRARPDIAAAFPDVPGADACGFRLRIPVAVAARLRGLDLLAHTTGGVATPIWTIAVAAAGAEAADQAVAEPPPRPVLRRPRRIATRRAAPAPNGNVRRTRADADLRTVLPSDFRVIALISTFNEADMIGWVIGHLAANGVHTYVIDDGSTDATVEIAKQWLGRGLLGIEPIARAVDGRTEWQRILDRKVELARELGADWYLHHDADEIRESPLPDLSLRDAIRWADGLGYNAIDFRTLNFRPVDDLFRPGQDPRLHFTRWEEPAAYDCLQRKAWKAGVSDVALVDGGHDVRFDGRRVFPIRFLQRHYPIRSAAHGRRKVFEDRQNRFVEAETAIGWHRQYEGFTDRDPAFLWNPAELQAFDLDQLRLEAVLEAGSSDAGSEPADPPPGPMGVRGHLDIVSPELIAGWVLADGDASEPVAIDLWDGGRRLITVLADGYRPDLEEAGMACSSGGFRLRPPASLLDGRPHWIWATVAATGAPLARSPLVLHSVGRISIGAGAAPGVCDQPA